MQDGRWYIFQTCQGLDQFKGEQINPWLIRHEKHSFITCMSHSPLSGEQFLILSPGLPKEHHYHHGPMSHTVTPSSSTRCCSTLKWSANGNQNKLFELLHAVLWQVHRQSRGFS